MRILRLVLIAPLVFIFACSDDGDPSSSAALDADLGVDAPRPDGGSDVSDAGGDVFDPDPDAERGDVDLADAESDTADVDAPDLEPDVSVIATCTEDEECTEGLVCLEARCLPDPGLWPGEACSEDDECAGSARCLAVDDVVAICVTCAEDDECVAGYCLDNECASLLRVGSACARDGMCATNRCAEGRCVQCTSLHDCVAGAYCDGGFCAPRQVVGTACVEGEACLSNTCADAVCAACQDTSQCPPSNYCDAGECLPRFADDEPADSAEQCLSGVLIGGACAPCAEASQCASSSDVCVGGICTSAKVGGQACVSGECASETCTDGTCIARSLDCRPESVAALLDMADDVNDGCSFPGPELLVDTIWFNELFGERELDGTVLPPCAAHDACYRACGCSQDHCDTQFRDQMMVWCDLWYAGDDLVTSAERLNCYVAAESYHAAVRTDAGADAWRNAQADDRCIPLEEADKVACISNAGCSADAFCDGGICHLDEPNGFTCTSNAQCTDGSCWGGVCSSCSWCDEGQYCDEGSCESLRGSGTPCNRDFECASGHCTYLVCAQCGSDIHCPADEFCAGGICHEQLGVNEPCLRGEMCESGRCVDHLCQNCAFDSECPGDDFCALNICHSPKANGLPCTRDEMCESGACSSDICTPCNSQDDCGEGEFCDLGICHSEKEDGFPCTYDYQCGSGYCDGMLDLPDLDWLTAYYVDLPSTDASPGVCGECSEHEHCTDEEFCLLGVCHAKKSYGALCLDEHWCERGTCSRGSAASSGVGGICTCDPFEAGSTAGCDEDQFCASTGFLPIPANACVPKLVNGVLCPNDDACQSGVCVAACADCPPICGCASDSGCDVDEFCETETHLCVQKAPLAAPCVDDRQCQSGLCDNLHCAECDGNSLLIDEFDNVDDWYGLTLESTLVQSGSAAGRFEVGGGHTLMSWTFTAPKDLSPETHIGFWLHSAVANHQILTAIIESPRPDSEDWSYYWYEFTVDWSGWSWVWLDKSEFGPVRDPLGWDKITKLNIYAHGWNGTPLADTDLVVDHMILASWNDGIAPCETGEFCETNSGLCMSKLSFPAPCTDDYQCVSGVCDGVCGCAGNAECEAIEFCETNTHACIDKLPLTIPCTDDYQCRSGLCRNLHCAECDDNNDCAGDEFCETNTGLCTPKLGFPAPCTDGYQCVSDYCGDISPWGQVCGCAGNDGCDGDEFCETNTHACLSKYVNGVFCTDDYQCQSGMCHNDHCVACEDNTTCASDQFCETNGGVCLPKFTFPMGCTDSYQCVSGYCGDISPWGQVCGCATNNECGGDQFCETNSHACLRKLSFPAGCTDDYQCVSGYCGSVDGFVGSVCGCLDSTHCGGSEWCDSNTHACLSKWPGNTPCTDDFQCSSGVCAKCATQCVDVGWVHECVTYCDPGCKTFNVLGVEFTLCSPVEGVCQ